MLRATRRVLRHAPVYSALVIASVALAVGLCASVIAAVAAVRWPESPFRDEDRLYVVYGKGDGSAGTVSSYDRLRLINRQTAPLSDVWLAEGTRALLSHGDFVEEATVLRLEPDFFRMFDRRPIQGRYPSEVDTIGPPVAMISDALWRRAFGSGSVVGKSLRIDGVDVAIIGVAPAGTSDLTNAHVWVAAPMSSFQNAGRYARLTALGKVTAETEQPQLERALRQVAAALGREHGVGRIAFGFTVSPMRAGPVPVSDVLWALIVAVVAIVVIASANLTNLALVRVSQREAMVAVQRAVGASTARVVTDLVAESIGLAVIGGTLGVSVLMACLGGLRRLIPDDAPFVGALRLRVDWRVFAGALLVALAMAVVFALVPGLRAAKADPGSALRASATSTGRRPGFAAGMLSALQVCVAIAMLNGSLLVSRAAHRSAAADPGFDSAGLFELGVWVRGATTPGLFESVLQSAAREPGVVSVA
ncbi:MAG: ABC transporter permease, partial [Gemmatimonadaceae bacterium]